MAASGRYQVYISRWVLPSGETERQWESWKGVSHTNEIEDMFPGLTYKSCTGLENQGEPRTYSEEYAEDSTPRVHLTGVRKTCDIKFEFVFRDVPAHGSTPARSRFAVLKDFTDHITGYRFKFTDSKRNIIRDMYLSGEAKVTESAFYGGEYLVAEFPCTSLNTPDLT